ncbi:MAG: tetratricopeptide repeat protein [Fimbriiglobus sp.]
MIYIVLGIVLVIAAVGFVMFLLRLPSPVEEIRSAIQAEDYVEARRLADIALEATGNDLIIADILDELGMIHRIKSEYAEAEHCYRRSLKRRSHALPEDAQGIGASHYNLALSLILRGKFKEAERHYRLAYNIHESCPESSDADRALACNGLSQVCLYLAQFEDTERLSRRAIALAEQAYGVEHATTAEIRLFCGGMQTWILGHYNRAERQFRQAIEQLERLTDRHSLLVLNGKKQFADSRCAWFKVMNDEAALVEAEKLVVEFIAICSAKMGEEEAMTAEGYYTLGSVRLLQGRPEEALQLASRALRIGENAVGSDHLSISPKRYILGIALLELNRLDEAEENLLAAVKLIEQNLWEDHFDAGHAHMFLGRVSMRRGNSADAERQYRKSLKVLTPLGSKHPNRVMPLRALAELLHAEGREVEAENVERELASIIEFVRNEPV